METNAVVFPNGPVLDPPTSWSVRAAPLTPCLEWSVSAIVWCGDVPDLESVVAVSATSGATLSRTATADCPAGKHLIGGGAFAFPVGNDLVSLV